MLLLPLPLPPSPPTLQMLQNSTGRRIEVAPFAVRRRFYDAP
jgi:hypothetical protein